MKLLILEGLDRCGKDTLIQSICARFPNLIKRHWGYPKGDTNEEKAEHQQRQFLWEFSFHKKNKYDFFTDNEMLMIWNRSHIGEYVYGTIYRDSHPETWIPELESGFHFDTNPNIYLVFLYADPEFLIKEDDGNSYSTKIDDKTREIDTFHQAIDGSKIQKKLKIKVNEGQEYINKDDILTQVIEFINS